METVEDGRKKVQSAQAVRDGERNSMEMGEQPKRICTCGIFTDTDVHGHERETSKKRVCQEKCVSFFVSFFTSVNLFCYLQIYHHHF